MYSYPPVVHMSSRIQFGKEEEPVQPSSKHLVRRATSQDLDRCYHYQCDHALKSYKKGRAARCIAGPREKTRPQPQPQPYLPQSKRNALWVQWSERCTSGRRMCIVGYALQVWCRSVLSWLNPNYCLIRFQCWYRISNSASDGHTLRSGIGVKSKPIGLRWTNNTSLRPSPREEWDSFT